MAIEDTAKALIQKNGRPISIRQRTIVPVDPAKPWGDTTESFADTPTFGAFIDENAKDLEARVSAVSRLVLAPVQVNGVQVYVAGKGLSVVPDNSMQIVDSVGRVMEIEQVAPVWKGSIAVIYICKVEN